MLTQDRVLRPRTGDASTPAPSGGQAPLQPSLPLSSQLPASHAVEPQPPLQLLPDASTNSKASSSTMAPAPAASGSTSSAASKKKTKRPRAAPATKAKSPVKGQGSSQPVKKEGKSSIKKEHSNIKQEGKSIKIVFKKETKAAETSSESAKTSSEEDSGGEDPGEDGMVSGEIGRERHISVRCYPVAAFSSNKTEKQFGLTRFVYLRHNTVLDKFLAKIETSASIELVGTRQQWLIALETKGRTDAFKDGIALELNHARCATTYVEWLKLVFEGRTAAVKIYGIAKSTIVTTGGDENRVPLQHVDPKVAAAAERIISSNTCNDQSCGKKSIAHPACWPIPLTTDHLWLTEAIVLPWATALAAQEPDIGERYPPRVPPFIVDRDATDSNSSTNPKSKKAKSGRNSKRKRTSAPSSDVEFFGHRKVFIISDSDSDGTAAAAKPCDDTNRQQSQPGPAAFIPNNSSTKRKRARGAYMPLNDFAQSYGLPESIRKKLEKFLIPDTYIMTELDPDCDYQDMGLILGEGLVLTSALNRWAASPGTIRGAYMLLNDFASAYGLSESILKKLGDYLISDSFAIAELDPDTDYKKVGLILGERVVLKSALLRWKENMPLGKGKARAVDAVQAADGGVNDRDVLQPSRSRNLAMETPSLSSDIPSASSRLATDPGTSTTDQ